MINKIKSLINESKNSILINTSILLLYYTNYSLSLCVSSCVSSCIKFSFFLHSTSNVLLRVARRLDVFLSDCLSGSVSLSSYSLVRLTIHISNFPPVSLLSLVYLPSFLSDCQLTCPVASLRMAPHAFLL